MPPGYAAVLADLKQRIQAAQSRAALAVNRELVLLYWSIGRDILTRQDEQGWGARVIDELSADLRHESRRRIERELDLEEASIQARGHGGEMPL